MVSVLLDETLSQKVEARRQVVPTPVTSKTSVRLCGQRIMVNLWPVLMTILRSAHPAALEEDRREAGLGHHDATVASLLPPECMTMSVHMGA